MPPDPQMAAELEFLFSNHMAYLTQKLVDDLHAGADFTTTVGAWQIDMRQDIKYAHAEQLVAGAGGDPSKVDPNDWLRLGTTIKSQEGYLEDFAHQILSGEVDPASVSSRAALYAKSAGVEYSRQATKELDLPAHPKDGSSPCLGNDDCNWRIEYEYDGQGNPVAALAYWDLGATEKHCDVCIWRYQNWNPLRIELQ
jgi:hypothetical protein